MMKWIPRTALVAMMMAFNMALLGTSPTPLVAEVSHRGSCDSCLDDEGLWYDCCPNCDGWGCNCTKDTACPI